MKKNVYHEGSLGSVIDCFQPFKGFFNPFFNVAQQNSIQYEYSKFETTRNQSQKEEKSEVRERESACDTQTVYGSISSFNTSQ